MVADRKIIGKKGQSLLEVLILLPFLFMFVGLLYKVNMATQMAMVNSQYARSQIYVLTGNSPEYPRLQFRVNPTMFAGAQQDRMVLGVADPTAITSSNGQTGQIDPIPQIQQIGRNQMTVMGSNDSGELGNSGKRTALRVRDTMAICTQLNATPGKLPLNDVNIPSLGSQRWPFGMSVCQYQGASL